eukprot:GHUV01018833.1.p1 GENE.GHUV01018833.1~~GHUV01018833.1.p1  ORF type:complete len:372 (+),score=127.89 GHUV01018833.1:691-1806(+)
MAVMPRAGASSSSQPQRKPDTTTRYIRAPGQQLPQLFTSAGRLTGGACRASGENGSQAPPCLFDGTLTTKWLDFGGGGVGGEAWAEYRLLPSQPAVVVTHYDIISAEDCPERDPCDWVLECVPVQEHSGDSNSSSSSSRTGGDNSAGRGSSQSWKMVDQQQGQMFSRRHQLHSFRIGTAVRVLSRQWRLRVMRTANPGAANSVQLSCWNLYSSSSSSCSDDSSSGGQLQDAAKDIGTQSHLLYLNPERIAELQRAVRSVSSPGAAADSDGPAATSATTISDSVPIEAVATVQRILRNMQQNPSNTKFWQLSATAVKLQPVLQSQFLLAVLLEAGFRPVLMQQGPELQLRLVADETAAANVAVVEQLLELVS